MNRTPSLLATWKLPWPSMTLNLWQVIIEPLLTLAEVWQKVLEPYPQRAELMEEALWLNLETMKKKHSVSSMSSWT